MIEQLDMEWQRVGLAAYIAGDHGDSAKLAHDTGVAEHDAVKQRPFYIGKRDGEEGAPA
ncbi:hypothetical protein D3C72_1858780 [compost metagenome]